MLHKLSLLLLLILTVLSLAGAPLKAADEACAPKPQVFISGDFTTRVSRFEPSTRSKQLVVIMPPTGGTNRIDLSHAYALCRAGMAAVIMDQWSEDQEYNLELAIHDRFYRRGQRAIELLLENISEEKIGFLGTSVGALHSAIAYERLPRIQAVFLIVGGAPIASILATSDQQILVEGKAKRFQMFGYRSEKEYERALEKVIPFEPLNLNASRNSRRVGMVISNSDGTVPAKNQRMLKTAWAPSLVLESSFGHIGTIIKTWLCDQDEVVKFFLQNLE